MSTRTHTTASRTRICTVKSITMTISTDDTNVESVIDALRRAGGRVTTARRLVVETLLSTHEHLTADDVASRIHGDHPEVHLSTVYRTLDALESIGLVAHTHVGHGPAVYHVSVPHEHQHMVCEKCGGVVDIPAASLDDLCTRLRAEYGFELHIGHFALLGHCRGCGEAAPAS
jgi:Fur family transcriptional regulator, ferric uptake regulator